MSQTLPYSQSYDLGVGINTVNLNAMGSIFSNIEMRPTIGAEGQTVNFFMSKINSTKELYESMGLSIEQDARFGVFSESAKFSFAKESNFNFSSVFLLLRVTVKNSVTHLSNPVVKQQIIDLVQSGNIDRLYDGFGDSYISEISTGGEFYSLFELTCQDETVKQKIEADFSASYSSMFDISVKFKDDMSRATKNTNFKLTTYQAGGKGMAVPQTIDEIIERAINFSKIVEDENGVIFNVSYKPYKTLPELISHISSVELESKKQKLDDIGKRLVDIRTDKNNWIYFALNQHEFNIPLEFNIPAALEGITKLDKYESDLLTYARNCGNLMENCNKVEPALPDLLINFHLPERKKLLDHLVLFSESNYTGQSYYFNKGIYSTSTENFPEKIGSIIVPDNIKAVIYSKPNFEGQSMVVSTSKLAPVSFPVKSIFVTSLNDPADKPSIENQPGSFSTGIKVGIISPDAFKSFIKNRT